MVDKRDPDATAERAFDALRPAARMLVALAALSPAPALERHLAAAATMPSEEFDAALAEAFHADVLTSVAPGQVDFRHDGTREEVRAQLGLVERRALARALADALVGDPAPPSPAVADLLLEAGDIVQAAAWLERAAREASARLDHTNAFEHLVAALALPAPRTEEERVALVERAFTAARGANRPEDAVPIVESALRDIPAPALQGRLLLARAGLALHRVRLRERLEALTAANQALARAGDARREAVVLGSLAMPIDALIPLRERARLGVEGLRLAEECADPFAIALCAANLAAAELALGKRSAFRRWARAVAALDPVDARSGSSEAAVAFGNVGLWAAGALTYGDYDLAAKVIDRGTTLASRHPADPRWLRSFDVLRSLHAWRTGDWTTAARELRLGPDVPAHDRALAGLVRALVAAERARDIHPDDLRGVRDDLLAAGDLTWAAAAQGLLMGLRASRREPRPARGLAPFVTRLAEAGWLTGWEDVLPAAAAVDAAACGRALEALGDVRGVTPRAEAALTWTRGLLALRLEQDQPQARALLTDAAERYEKLGEPYAMALALEALATSGATARGTAEVALRAAQTFHDLGANRSLNRLLVAKPRLRALEPFRAARPHVPGEPGRLTPREREIAEFAARGYTAGEIARELTLSIRTVEKHLERVRAKLGVERKSQLVRALDQERFGGQDQ